MPSFPYISEYFGFFNIYFCNFFIWLCWVLVVAFGIFVCSMWNLVSWPGIEAGAPTLGVQSLSLWTTRDVPLSFFFKLIYFLLRWVLVAALVIFVLGFSLVVAPGLWSPWAPSFAAHGLSSPRLWDLSSLNRDSTHIPCIPRWIFHFFSTLGLHCCFLLLFFGHEVVLTLCNPMDCSTSGSSAQIWSLLRFMSIKSVMLSNHLILCCPFLLLPSIFPRIRVFSNESALYIRWP